MTSLDPNIILSAQKPIDPVESLQRAYTLRNLAQQNQAGALGLQGEQMKLAQMKQSVADQADFRQAANAQALAQRQPQTGPAQTRQPQTDLSAIQPGATMPAQPQQQAAAPALSGQQRDEMDRQNTMDLINRLDPGNPHRQEIMDQYLKRSKEMAGTAKDYAATAKDRQEISQKQAQRLGSLAGAITDEASFHRNVGTALHEGLLTGPDAAQALSMPWNAQTQAVVQGWRRAGLAPEQQQAGDIAQQSNARAEREQSIKDAVAPSQLQESQAKATSATIDASQKTRLGMSEDQSQMLQLRAKEIAKLNSPAQLAYQAENPATPEPERQAARAALKILEQHAIASRPVVNNRISTQDSGVLTPDDYKRAGAEYAITGVMPALGNGSGAVKQRLIHEKMNFARDNNLSAREMALAKNAFAGDAKSLAAFQTQRDQIVSFENTASKNLDMFLDAASKIPDSGNPWVNTPLRLVDQKMMGSVPIAVANAARAVATNEVAKVTTGGGMNGILSDSARQEVKNYNPENATFAQTVAVVKLLKADMKNRHSSMDNMIATIRDRTGTFDRPADTTGGNTGGNAGGKIKVIRISDGQPGTIDPADLKSGKYKQVQ